MTDGYIPFKLKGIPYRHIENGWCAREVKGKWRLYWGKVQPGADNPTYVNAYQEQDSDIFLDLPEFVDCIRWVQRRADNAST